MNNQMLILVINIIIMVFLVVFFILYVINIHKSDNLKNSIEQKLDEKLDEKYQHDMEFMKTLNQFENNIIQSNNKNQTDLMKITNDSNKVLNEDINKSLNILRDVYDRKLNDMIQSNDTKLSQLITANEQKLTNIQEGINHRLDTSLNEKLNQNFKTIGDSLSNLYNSLGEIKQLSNGVSDLQKTLSNVKSGGNFGEAQLDVILGDMLSKDQYYVQYNLEQDDSKTKRIVDFVVKIPDKSSTEGIIYLPIDSKFNMVKFNNLLAAKETYDENKITDAEKELKDAINLQAKSIKEKYIVPPLTTDFALMFLPSEGLFAECMNIRNLSEDIKTKYQVVLVGPTTISAILKSFAIGFRYMKISDSAQKINTILIDIKNQYTKFSEDIKSLKKSLDTATDRTNKLERRTESINKKLNKISDSRLDMKDDDKILTDNIIDEDEMF